MYLPPLQATHDSPAQQIGDITVHSSVAIAPGVLLQAEAGSQIIIAASVCIGMGSVIHAYGGVLEIREGVNLGAGVLILGSGVIGAHACIGTSSTVIECSVSSQQILPPGSLLGDRSRSMQPEPESIPTPTHAAVESSPTLATPDPWETDATSQSTYQYPEQPSYSHSQTVPTPQAAVTNGGTRTAPIHGKDYVNTLLSTLMPHRTHSIPPTSESSS
jgi:carbon dioxide concentrating mechanism protein CcmN